MHPSLQITLFFFCYLLIQELVELLPHKTPAFPGENPVRYQSVSLDPVDISLRFLHFAHINLKELDFCPVGANEDAFEVVVEVEEGQGDVSVKPVFFQP